MTTLSQTYQNLAEYNQRRAAFHAASGDWEKVCKTAKNAAFYFDLSGRVAA